MHSMNRSIAHHETFCRNPVRPPRTPSRPMEWARSEPAAGSSRYGTKGTQHIGGSLQRGSRLRSHSQGTSRSGAIHLANRQCPRRLYCPLAGSHFVRAFPCPSSRRMDAFRRCVGLPFARSPTWQRYSGAGAPATAERMIQRPQIAYCWRVLRREP